MKRIRNVVFRFFFDIWNFFLNWKILPFERSTFSLFYLLIVLPFVVLPYNRQTFFILTFLILPFVILPFVILPFLLEPKSTLFFLSWGEPRFFNGWRNPNFFYLNSISKALANFLISILYMLFTKNKILKWLASLPPVCMNDATYK